VWMKLWFNRKLFENDCTWCGIDFGSTILITSIFNNASVQCTSVVHQVLRSGLPTTVDSLGRGQFFQIWRGPIRATDRQHHPSSVCSRVYVGRFGAAATCYLLPATGTSSLSNDMSGTRKELCNSLLDRYIAILSAMRLKKL
jgi:hypothetical protein